MQGNVSPTTTNYLTYRIGLDLDELAHPRARGVFSARQQRDLAVALRGRLQRGRCDEREHIQIVCRFEKSRF